jgi:glycosyltransferase involved in cell wall biosynthesis
MPSPADNIAVIIPVYHVTRFLEEAIASVVAQGDAAREICVVDDGSAPEQAAVIAAACAKFPRVVLVRQPHAGAAAAREAGIAKTRAPLILFLDADDMLLAGALEHLMGSMQRHPDCAATYGRMRNVDAGGAIMDEEARPSVAQLVSGRQLLLMLLEKQFLLYNGTVCMRRSALEAIRPRHHALTLGEDWVLWCHLALFGDMVAAGERVVLHYRRHDRNISSTLLDDPSAVFASIEAVFSDPIFRDALGIQELQALHARCTGRMHAYLASGYAKRLQWDKARMHMAQGGRFIKALHDQP